jgi:hypothetical protein
LSQEVLDMGLFIHFLSHLKDELNVLLYESEWGRWRRILHHLGVHFFRYIHCFSYVPCICCIHCIHCIIFIHCGHNIQGGLLPARGNLFLHYARASAKEVVGRVGSWRVQFFCSLHIFHRNRSTSIPITGMLNSLEILSKNKSPVLPS